MTSFTIVNSDFAVMATTKKKGKKYILEEQQLVCLFVCIHLSRSNDKQWLEEFNILR
jgi:hypothetical protein